MKITRLLDFFLLAGSSSLHPSAPSALPGVLALLLSPKNQIKSLKNDEKKMNEHNEYGQK